MDNDFNFNLISDFPGYDSCRDKTNLAAAWLVKNSKNMYKKLSGTIASRFGRKYVGQLDGRAYGVKANYDWSASNGVLHMMRVTADFVLSTFFAGQWVQLLTGLSGTRYVFDKWYDSNQDQDALLMVNGGTGIQYWSGGISKISGGSVVPNAAQTVTLASGGSGYAFGDILTIDGGLGSNLATIIVLSLNVTAIATFELWNPGDGYFSTANAVPTVAVTGSGSGATFNITAVGQSTATWYITKDQTDGFDTFEEAGFVGTIAGQTSPTVSINGSSFSYIAINDDVYSKLVVNSSPLSLAAGSIAFNPVTNVLDAVTGSASLPNTGGTFTNDFIKVIGNQVYVGCYKNRIIWASSGVNYVDAPGNNNMADLFTFDPGVLASGITTGPLGSAFYVILDDNPTGISLKSGAPVFFGKNGGLYEIAITQTTIGQGTVTTTSGSTATTTDPSRQVQTVTPTRTQLYSQSTPQAHEFIASDGNYIVWLGLDNQLHVFGAPKDILLSDIAPSLSQQIQDELNSVNFTGGALAWIDEYIFITAPLAGTHYMFQQRQQVEESGVVKTERIWNPPQIAGISRFSNSNGVIYGHALDQPMMYQMFDTSQWHDDGVDSGNNLIALPYECFMSMAYQQLPGKTKSVLRANSLRFDKLYFEGYIQPGTPLYGNVYYEYQGSGRKGTGKPGIVGIYINGVPSALDLKNTILKFIKKIAKLFSYTDAPSLGGDFLNDNPLGQGITPFANAQDYLPKFRTINKLELVNCFEFQIEVYSYDTDARWEILALGANITEAPENEHWLTR